MVFWCGKNLLSGWAILELFGWFGCFNGPLDDMLNWIGAFLGDRSQLVVVSKEAGQARFH